MIEPHGGDLVDRTVGSDRADDLRDSVAEAPHIQLSRSQYQELVNVAVGRYSPIEGFLSRNDFLKVVTDMTLEDGTVWPLPITLDVGPEKAASLDPGERVGLVAPDGDLVGTLTVDEVYRHNTERTASELFGTDDPSHHGVKRFLNQQEFQVGGPVHFFGDPYYNHRDILPAETRVLFRERGWETVVGFQTRNAPHRAHEYIQKSALEVVDGLLVQPKLGDKQPGDYRDGAIIAAYETLVDEYYAPGRVALTVFPSPMRYAGPREAVFDALVRKNQGCTHFIVGRDHAGVEDFYDEFGAQHIFDRIRDIGITPLFYNYSFFCHRCDGMTSEKVCPHGDDDRVYPSGSEIRSVIQDGGDPDAKMMRPEVSATIAGLDEPFITDSDQPASEAGTR